MSTPTDTETATAHEELLRAGRDTLQPRIVVDYGAKLGEGAFGSVYAAAWKDGGEDGGAICVKAVSMAHLSAKCAMQLRRELALHAQAAHPHILPMLGAFRHGPSTLHLVLRRARGDLAVVLRHAPAAVRPLAARLLAQLLRALEHLHADDICHSDVKPSNLLLDADGALQLCDLGAAARIGAGGRSTLVGSPAYLAPEVVAIGHLGLQVSGASYAHAADVWSAGVVLVEVLSGALPFAAEPRDAAAQPAAICFRPPRLPADMGAEARGLALQLLAKQAYLRPTAAEALEAPLLRGRGGVGAPSADEAAAIARCLAVLATTGFEVEHGLAAAGDAFATPASGRPKRAGGGGETSGGSAGEQDESPCSLPSWASSLVDGSP